MSLVITVPPRKSHATARPVALKHEKPREKRVSDVSLKRISPPPAPTVSVKSEKSVSNLSFEHISLPQAPTVSVKSEKSVSDVSLKRISPAPISSVAEKREISEKALFDLSFDDISVIPTPSLAQKRETLREKVLSRTEQVETEEETVASAKEILESQLEPLKTLPLSITQKDSSLSVLPDNVLFLFNTHGFDIRPYAGQTLSVIEHFEKEYRNLSFEDRYRTVLQAIAEVAHMVSSPASPLLYEQTLRTHLGRWLLVQESRGIPSLEHLAKIIQLATWDNRFILDSSLVNALPEIVSTIADRLIPSTLSFNKALGLIESITAKCLQKLQTKGAGSLLPRLEILFRDACAAKLTSLLGQDNRESYSGMGQFCDDISVNLLRIRHYQSQYIFPDLALRKHISPFNMPQKCISEIFQKTHFIDAIKHLQDRVEKEAELSYIAASGSEKNKDTVLKWMGRLVYKNQEEPIHDKINRIKNNKLNSIHWAEVQWHSQKIIPYPPSPTDLISSSEEPSSKKEFKSHSSES